VDGSLSTLVPVISGVPQGIVLGPCLFLVHLIGISSSLSLDTTASSFADLECMAEVYKVFSFLRT
jgi:hypothetical protein